MFRSFFLPIFCGFVAHLVTTNYILPYGLLHSVYAFQNDRLSLDYVLIRGVAAQFFYVVESILPGLVIGLVAVKNPARLGFIGVLFAQIFIICYSKMDWINQIDPERVISFAFEALRMSVYGLFMSIAGFAIKQNFIQSRSDRYSNDLEEVLDTD